MVNTFHKNTDGENQVWSVDNEDDKDDTHDGDDNDNIDDIVDKMLMMTRMKMTMTRVKMIMTRIKMVMTRMKMMTMKMMILQSETWMWPETAPQCLSRSLLGICEVAARGESLDLK